MKRKILGILTLLSGTVMFAQEIPFNQTMVLDAAEDTTQVTSIDDIIAVQEIVTSRNSSVTHFSKVWSRNSYFNIAYSTNATLKPKSEIDLGYEGYNKGIAPKFKADWGISLMLGHNYRLHKKPIANIVQFNLDYTYIDLCVNHYNAEKGEKLYDSGNTWEHKDENNRKELFIYTPWCLQKYDINYGMMIGPSITVAPFTYINIPQLQFIKLNIYYHIGYHASLLWIISDKSYDANPAHNPTSSSIVTNAQEYGYEKMNNALKMNIGHGLVSSFGFNLSWKSIGFGYEVRNGKLKYESLNKSVFGSKKYKFDAVTSRIYLQIRY